MKAIREDQGLETGQDMRIPGAFVKMQIPGPPEDLERHKAQEAAPEQP